VEDRISGLENKTDIKEKTEESLHKRQELQKEYVRTQQFHQNAKLENHGTEEGKEVQAKGICNIFNKIITEISQISRKRCPSSYRKPPGHQTNLTKIEPLN
jgi:hypothetical protein